MTCQALCAVGLPRCRHRTSTLLSRFAPLVISRGAAFLSAVATLQRQVRAAVFVNGPRFGSQVALVSNSLSPRTVLVQILLAFPLLGQTLRPSAFSSYVVHLGSNAMRAACSLQNASYLRNLTYPFRARAYPGQRSLPFKDGLYAERVGLDGALEWSTELARQEPIQLGKERAVMLMFFANHVGGTESVSHVPVIRCKHERLEVVFEAGEAGMRSSYARRGDLLIAHPVWCGGDSHTAPSRVVDEKYRWDVRRGQFFLMRRTEREGRIR